MSYLLYTEDFPDFAPGAARQTGIGRYCYDLAAGLAATGQRVTVLTHDAPGQGPLPSAEGFELLRIGRRPSSTRDLPLRGWMVARELRRLAPERMIVGDPEAHRVFSLVRRSTVTSHYAVFYGTELRALRSPASSPSLLARLRRRLAQAYIASAAERVCISRFTREELRALMGPQIPAFVLHPSVSGIFLTRPRNAGFRLPGEGEDEPLRLLTIGRISQRKNQLRVVEVLARLRRERGLRFRYYVLGNVDSPAHSGYMEELRRCIRENGLNDDVRVIEGTTDEEKVDFIDRCDVFIMLSQTSGNSVEGFGIAPIEASCRGKPVVVSDDGGMPETVVQGVTGLSVPHQSDRAIKNALLQLAENPGLRARMGAAGASHVRQNFTPRIMGERLHRHLTGLPAANDRNDGAES